MGRYSGISIISCSPILPSLSFSLSLSLSLARFTISNSCARFQCIYIYYGNAGRTQRGVGSVT